MKKRLLIGTNAYDIYRDVESEKALLESFYVDPEQLYQVTVQSQDFTNQEYRSIYETMLTLYADGIAFTPKTIMDQSMNTIQAGTIIDIMSNAFTATNTDYHAKRIRQAAFNRQAREQIVGLEKELGTEQFLVSMEKSINILSDFQTSRNPGSLSEIIGTVKSQIAETKKTLKYGISTGFNKLDSIMVGFCPGHLILLGGYTSQGKSTLLSQIVSNVAKNGVGILIFSVEDSKEDKLVRLIATETGIPIKYIVTGQASEGRLEKAQSDIYGYNLHIYDDIYRLDEMELKIKKHKMQHNIKLVAIDFVQNIMAEGDIYQAMRNVAIRLQQMGKKHHVTMFGLSQITEGKDKASISLRGAQELASAADIVLWLERKQDSQSFELVVRKNRPFGETGKIAMKFSDSWTNMREVMFS